MQIVKLFSKLGMLSDKIQEDDKVIQEAIHSFNQLEKSEPDDPLLVIFWNEIRVNQLAIQHGNPKQQILDFLVQNGGQLLEPFQKGSFTLRNRL